MTAKLNKRSGESVPRKRSQRSPSLGSIENKALASGNNAAEPVVCPCNFDAPRAKPDTKSAYYHSSAKDGSNPMADTDITPPPDAAVAVLSPAVDVQALVLNDPAALAERLRVYGESRKLLVEWLLSKLVPGIDFTLIHRKIGPRGSKTECPNVGNLTGRVCEECGGKSTLCKPGSEKICGLLQLRPVFSRDVETWEMLGSEPGVLALKCELVTANGTVVAEGRGARHRDMDYGDLNKSVKMVQKSAQTDAVLRCAGLSEIFTQDLEDMPGGGFQNGDAAEDFQTPKAQGGAAPAAPVVRAPVLREQLDESVRRAAAVPAGTPLRERSAMIRGTQQTPPPMRRPPVGRAPQAGSSTGATPPDALSPARVNRLYALLHEAIRGAEVPEEQHEGVFSVARRYLTDWVGQTQGRESIADCSWKAYDELCAQIPAAVDAALGQEPPPSSGPRYPRPRPRIVRRSYAAPQPRPFLRRGY